MKTIVASVVCALVLAALSAAVPADLDSEIWFPTSVHPYGPPNSRFRRDTATTQKPLNATHVPSSVCVSMTPAHGLFKPQTTDAPYTITVDKTSVRPGDIVTVTISGTDTFKGIYIQGRYGDTPVGTFMEHENNAVVISDCEPGTNNALSYVSRTDLDVLVLKWKAPSTPGKVIFRCTFVKNFGTFWVGEESDKVTVQ